MDKLRKLDLSRRRCTIQTYHVSGAITYILIVLEVVGACVDAGEGDESLSGPVSHCERSLESLGKQTRHHLIKIFQHLL